MFVCAILAFVGLAVSILFVVLRFVTKAGDPVKQYNESEDTYKRRIASAPASIAFYDRFWKISLAVGIVSFFLWKSVFYASPGHYYAVQWFTGKQVSHMDAGFHFRGWGQVIEMKQNLTLKFSDNEDGEYSGWAKPFGVQFNDAVRADVSASIRVSLPSNPREFMTLALEYRSQENLVNSSLMPAAREVLRNSARMISAQDYILGKGGVFESAVFDQLQNGIYMLEVKVVKNEEQEKIQQDSSRSINHGEAVVTEVLIQRDKVGQPIRKAHAFVRYGIEISQAIVDNVDPEEKFKALLAMQRDAAGKSNVARQEALKAEFEKQRVIAQGETKKAEIRVDEEQKQIAVLISAETEMKEKEIETRKQKYSVTAATLEAQATKITADADAYARERKMKADGALEQKLAALVSINQAYAEAIKGTQMVPSTYIGGSDGHGGNGMDFLKILTANAAAQVNSVYTKEK